MSHSADVSLLPVPEIIRRPVEPFGSVIRDDDLVEKIETGREWRSKAGEAWVRIELAQADGGLWMWSSSYWHNTGGASYRVGPKWGKFARSRGDAIAAACRELIERNSKLPQSALDWMIDLCGARPEQIEMF